jgi:hypothetical protein
LNQAVGVIGAVGTTRVAIIIVLGSHAVEGVDKLIIVLCFTEDLLVIDTSHHHMEDTGF